jgi:hypothetical protein
VYGESLYLTGLLCTAPQSSGTSATQTSVRISWNRGSLQTALYQVLVRRENGNKRREFGPTFTSVANLSGACTRLRRTLRQMVGPGRRLTKGWVFARTRAPASASTTSYTVTDLTPATTYTIQVQALTADGSSSNALLLSVTTSAVTSTLQGTCAHASIAQRI